MVVAYNGIDEWLNIILSAMQPKPNCSHHDCQTLGTISIERMEGRRLG